MRIQITMLVVTLAACSNAQRPPDSTPKVEAVADVEAVAEVEGARPGPEPLGRPLRLIEVDPALELEEFDGVEVGSDRVRLLEGGDATSYYAGVRVNDEPARWLDLYTAEQRADGASPTSGWGWVHMTVAPDGETIVGVLDWFVESSGPTLYIVTSQDGGRSWALRAEIDKPHYMALFEELVLYPDEWELTIRLRDCGGCDSLAGDTVWVSPPGGDAWSLRSEPTTPDRPSR